MAFKKIQEYLSTEDGTQGTLLIPKLIMPNLIAEVDKALIPNELAAEVKSPNMIQGTSFSVNLETPNSMDVREVAEGAEIPLDNQTYTSTTVTPKKFGVAIRITRELMEDSQFELLQRNIRLAGKRLAEKQTELILTELDNSGNDVAGGAQVTIANITQAMQNLEDNDFEATDMLVGPEFVNDLRNIDTFVEANKAGNTDMLDRGFSGTLYGMEVRRFSKNAAPSASSGKFGYVLDRSQAYGIATKRDITVENFDLASYDLQGAAITWRFAAYLLRANAVSRITTA